MNPSRPDGISATTAENVMAAAEKILKFVCDNVGESAEVQVAAMEVATKAIEATATAQNVAETRALFKRKLR